MVEIYVNNIRLDINENSIKQTFQNNDLGEVENRQINFTNRFKVPKTPNNKKVFDLLSVAGNNATKQYKNLPARIIYNGLEVVSDGYCYIKKSTPLYYEIVVYSGISSLFEQIKDLTLQDLDLSKYNHVVKPSVIVNSFSNTEGYIYAAALFIHNEEVPENEVWYLNYSASWLPSMFEKTIFKEIIEQAGFTFSGINFDNFVVPPSSGITRNMDGTTTSFLNKDYSVKKSFQRYSPISEDDPIVHSELIGGFIVEETGYHNLTITGNENTEVDYNRDLGNHVGRPYYRTFIEIKDYGTSEEIELYNVHHDIHTINENLSRSYYKGQNLKIYYKVYVNTSYVNNADPAKVNINIDSSFNINIDYTSSQEIYTNFNLLMPDINQVDFLKEVMWRYGLSLRSIRNTNHYEFRRVDDIVSNFSDAIDWSEKFSEVISETYKVGDYAQKNIFLYSDNKYKGFLTIDNPLLKEEQTVLTSNYESHEDDKIKWNGLNLQSNKVFEVEYKENSGFLKNLKALEIDEKKIFSLDYQDANLTIQNYNNSNVKASASSVPCLAFKGLDFQTHIDNNYQNFKQVLSKSLLLSVKIHLSVIDVYNLNFFKLIYLRQYGSYFYINKIKDFEMNKVSTCELIKIPSIISPYGYYENGETYSIIGSIIGTIDD